MMLQTVLLIVHILLALALIGVILIQHGKGASMGAAFGSGASSTVFGARGSANFLTRTTTVLAILFFANSFLLSYLYARNAGPTSLMERVEVPAAPAAPAEPAPAQAEGASAPAEPATAGAPAVPQVPAEQPPAAQTAPAGAPLQETPVPQVPGN